MQIRGPMRKVSGPLRRALPRGVPEAARPGAAACKQARAVASRKNFPPPGRDLLGRGRDAERGSGQPQTRAITSKRPPALQGNVGTLAGSPDLASAVPAPFASLGDPLGRADRATGGAMPHMGGYPMPGEMPVPPSLDDILDRAASSLREVEPIDPINFLEQKSQEKGEDTTRFGTFQLPEGRQYEDVFAYLIPRENYYSEEAFNREQDTIFNNSWVPIAYTSEFSTRLKEEAKGPDGAKAGEAPKSWSKTLLCRRIYGRELLVVKDKRGEIRVFYNMCRHRGHRLAKQDSSQKTLICPYHAWRYRLDGSLAKTPRFDTDDDFKREFGLVEVPCEVMGDFLIMVNFGRGATEGAGSPAGRSQGEAGAEDPARARGPPPVPPATLTPNGVTYPGLKPFRPLDARDYHGLLHDMSDYPLKDLKVVREKKYFTHSNWKNLIDNFIEYYHLPTIHQALVQVSTMEGHVCNQKRGKYMGFKTEPLTAANTPIDPDGRILGGLFPRRSAKTGEFSAEVTDARDVAGTEDIHGKAQFHTLFPNMFWFLYPNHVFSVIVDPLSPGMSVEHATLMVHKDVDEAEHKKEIDAMFAFYDTVNTEDVQACEEVQKGMAESPTKLLVPGRGAGGVGAAAGGASGLPPLNAVCVMPYEKTIRRFHRIMISEMEGEGWGEREEAEEDELLRGNVESVIAANERARALLAPARSGAE